MTLQEAKDEVAQSRSYRNWAEMETMQHQKSASSWQDLLKATEEAAELYAKSKLEELAKTKSPIAVTTFMQKNRILALESEIQYLNAAIESLKYQIPAQRQNSNDSPFRKRWGD